MDPLINDLRELDPPAPPPRLDLDAVVARGLRRRLRTRFAAAGAVVAVLAGTAGLGLALQRTPAAVTGVTSPPPECVPVVASPGPSASSAATTKQQLPTTEEAERLTTALRQALHSAMPDAETVTTGTCDPDWSMIPQTTAYVVLLDVYDAAGRQLLTVSVNEPVGQMSPGTPICGNDTTGRSTCVSSELADGTILRTIDTRLADGVVSRMSEAFRPDSPRVAVGLNNWVNVDLDNPSVSHFKVTRPQLSLSTDQLQAVAIALLP
ncbi:hypothetical protein [Dactylosporangium sp. CA-233914]|uniref:hypothetical protein n=1 Tax=Dactylosporangium sp. CA-233914 TaxID=3239934 RepID=UPI003D926301